MDEWPSIDLLSSVSVSEKLNWLLMNTMDSAGSIIKRVMMRQSDDFFDNDLENMRKEKNRLYKLAQFARRDRVEEINRLWINYKEFRNEYKRTIVEKRFMYNQRKLDKVNGDIKGTWRVLNSILHKDSDDILFIEIDGVQIDSEAEMASEFNNFFVQSISRLNDEIPPVTFECNIVNYRNVKFEFGVVSISKVKS